MRFSTALVLALPALAVASDVVSRGLGDQCDTGSISCCNQVQQANPTTISILQGLIGGTIGPITGLIGLGCSPLSIAGVGGNSCSAQPVCCSSNTFGGLVGLGCNPINLNL